MQNAYCWLQLSLSKQSCEWMRLGWELCDDPELEDGDVEYLVSWVWICNLFDPHRKSCDYAGQRQDPGHHGSAVVCWADQGRYHHSVSQIPGTGIFIVGDNLNFLFCRHCYNVLILLSFGPNQTKHKVPQMFRWITIVQCDIGCPQCSVVLYRIVAWQP